MLPKFNLSIFATAKHKNTIMRNIKFILITWVLSFMTARGFSETLYLFHTNTCLIYFGKQAVKEYPVSNPSVKRAPVKGAQVKVGDNIYVSFTSELNDVSISVLFNGAEIYNESYVNVVSGDVFSCSITEVGEYTVIVSVNGETVAEGTVNVEL